MKKNDLLVMSVVYILTSVIMFYINDKVRIIV